ncbi:MAG: hypothetical protein GY701_09700, partial [Sulfitobacter sp.]|nr:hypothetical protein [Sulfitobacter sp.]
TGEVIFSDTMPASGLSYASTVSMANAGNFVGGVDCVIAANVITCTATQEVVMVDGDGFDLSIAVTPVDAGSYTNPATGPDEVCEVDPDNVVPETTDTAVPANGANNSCEDTVEVPLPNLTAEKSNNVNGVVNLGETFEWTIAIRNEGAGNAVFAASEVIFRDYLPATGISYANVSVTNAGGLVGGVDCTLATATQIECTATSDITLSTDDGFDVIVEATPTDGDSFTNPADGTGEVCEVDPDMVVPETGDDTNTGDNATDNDCEDTVT